MSELILPDHLQDQSKKPSTDFEAWKKESGVLNPTPLQAWNFQVSYITELEKKVVNSVELIKRSRKTIEDLKNMFEENLKIMSDLEIENLKLKGILDEQKDLSKPNNKR